MEFAYDGGGIGKGGAVTWVQIDIDAAAADQDHLTKPEERFRLAMAKQ